MNILLLFVVIEDVVAAVFNRLSKLSTLKCAAAADSVNRNACGGATRVSNPSMIMAAAGPGGAMPPKQIKQKNKEIKDKC